MKRILLNDWMLSLAENREVQREGYDPKTIGEIESSEYIKIPASVPGNFELDLHKAGLIADPYYADGPFALQKLENCHLWYYTVFPGEDAEGETVLDFEGVDTVADIYLNAEKIAHTENMLIAHEIPVGKLKETNELIVHIYPTAIEARKKEAAPLYHTLHYNMDATGIRKAASMFGWDIMPRIVSGGLYKEVALLVKDPVRIEDAYLYTMEADPATGHAKLGGFVRFVTDEDDLAGYRLRIEGRTEGSAFSWETAPFSFNQQLEIEVENAKLWWPKNSGEPVLYDVKVLLTSPSGRSAVKEFRFGIRTVALTRTSTTDASGCGEFVFRINGRKIFVLGTNWVPLDAFPSRYPGLLPRALALLQDTGCNMVRCWGGNVYENDAFYDFCDANGIMVWQDFSMACGIYPQDADFAEQLEEEVLAVVKRLRNHVSLTLWAGDNECDEIFRSLRQNPDTNRLTRQVIPEVLRLHDFTRPYLPSSPYIDGESFRTGLRPPEDHTWGPRDYFKGEYYGRTVCHFASEAGYHGCPSENSLRKFIPPEHLWDPKLHNMQEDGTPDVMWLCHAASMETDPKAPYAYRIGLMNSQVETLFGRMPDTLSDFVMQSQISQAEAMKYFIERFRLSKWCRTGIIWWNLIDGWPQISDAVVDYYGEKKLAYDYIKRSQQPVCLMFDEPEKSTGTAALYAVNDLPDAKRIRYGVTRMSDGREMLHGEALIPADQSVKLAEIPAEASRFETYRICWEGEAEGQNHYCTGLLKISYEQYMEQLTRAGVLGNAKK